MLIDKSNSKVNYTVLHHFLVSNFFWEKNFDKKDSTDLRWNINSESITVLIAFLFEKLCESEIMKKWNWIVN